MRFKGRSYSRQVLRAVAVTQEAKDIVLHVHPPNNDKGGWAVRISKEEFEKIIEFIQKRA